MAVRSSAGQAVRPGADGRLVERIVDDRSAAVAASRMCFGRMPIVA